MNSIDDIVAKSATENSDLKLNNTTSPPQKNKAESRSDTGSDTTQKGNSTPSDPPQPVGNTDTFASGSLRKTDVGDNLKCNADVKVQDCTGTAKIDIIAVDDTYGVDALMEGVDIDAWSDDDD